MAYETPELRRMSRSLDETDPEIAAALRDEVRRQATGLELIPSENFVSEAVIEAMGSVLTNKYAEGYPGKRYYGGCEFVDRVEQLAIDRAKAAFRRRARQRAAALRHAGQYRRLYDRAAARRHGAGNEPRARRPPDARPSAEFFRQDYKFVAYGVTKETETIDYDELDRLAQEHKPKMIVAGASAYSRIIDFARMAKIAQSDRRAAVRGHGAHRRTGRRGRASQSCAARRFCFHHHAQDAARPARRTGSLPRKIRQGSRPLTFPGVQGGPLMHIIAAKAVCLKEAVEPEFREYQKQVVRERAGAGSRARPSAASASSAAARTTTFSWSTCIRAGSPAPTRNRRSIARASP